MKESFFYSGFDQEGLFRISGNVRIMEKLRQSFDQYGDANLEEDGDIMAVAGLLKLFLRELPESIIPEHMTSEFIAIEDGEFKLLELKYCACILAFCQYLQKSNQLPSPQFDYWELYFIMCTLGVGVNDSCYY